MDIKGNVGKHLQLSWVFSNCYLPSRKVLHLTSHTVKAAHRYEPKIQGAHVPFCLIKVTELIAKLEHQGYHRPSHAHLMVEMCTWLWITGRRYLLEEENIYIYIYIYISVHFQEWTALLFQSCPLLAWNTSQHHTQMQHLNFMVQNAILQKEMQPATFWLCCLRF